MNDQQHEMPTAKPPFADIDQCKDEIHHLYVEEDRSLKDIMMLMRKRGCNASRNMYLKRFKAWGFEKYMKKDRLLQLRQQSRADQVGNQTENQNGETEALHFQGKTITSKEVSKYFERKIYYNTGEEILNFTTVSAPNSLKLPDTLDTLDQLFKSLYSTQRWFVSMDIVKHSEAQEDVYNALYHSFTPDVMNGVELLYHGQHQVGGAMIERGLQSAEQVLNLMDPAMLHTLLYMGVYSIDLKMSDFAQILFSYICRLSSKVLGAHHALTRLFAVLHRSTQFTTIHTGLRVLYDATVNVAGKLDFRSIWIQNSILLSNYMEPANIRIQDLCAQYEEFLPECDQLSTKSASISARRNLGLLYITDNKIAQGIALLREVLPILYESPSPNKTIIQNVIHCCYDLGEKLMEISSSDILSNENEKTLQKYYLEAEKILKTTVEQSILLLGPENSNTLMAAETLARMYEKFGRLNESATQFEFVLEQLTQYRLS